MNIYYSVDDLGDGIVFELEGVRSLSEEFEKIIFARAAAQDYWDNHEGNESYWPLTFTFYDSGGHPIYSCLIEAWPTVSFGVENIKEINNLKGEKEGMGDTGI